MSKVDNFDLLFSLKSGSCDLRSLPVFVDHDDTVKSNHGRAILVVTGGLNSDDTDILS